MSLFQICKPEDLSRITKTGRPRKVLVELYGSVIIWILLTLLVLDIFLVHIRPLQYIRIRGLVTADQEPLDEKIQTLYSSIKKPDLLILGSSLPMCACVGADWQLQHRPKWTTNFCERYTGSSYFDSLLKKHLSLNLRGYDLAMPACMISDDYTILKNAVEKGIKPKLIMLAVAPRDFIDNSAPPFEGSRYSKYFADRMSRMNISTSKSINDNAAEVLS